MLSLILSLVSLLVIRRGIPQQVVKLGNRRFDLFYFFAFLGSRLVTTFVVFFLLHQKPRGDIWVYYLPEAHLVLKGLIPYQDFVSSYAPLNAYLDAALLWLHDTPFSIISFEVICDALSIPFWIGFCRRFLREDVLRIASSLYLLQPLVLWGTAIDGKNHALLSLLLAIALYFIAKREVISGISYSLTLVFVKILPLMFLPALFMGAKHRFRWFTAAIVLPTLVYGGFILHHIDVTVPIHAEGARVTAANLPYLLAALFGQSIPARSLDAVALVLTGGAVLYAAVLQSRTRTDEERSSRLWLSILLVLFTVLIFTKKSDPIYLSMCFFLLSALASQLAKVREWGAGYAYALLTFLVLPISSFWFWPLNKASGAQLHTMMMSGNSNALIMVAAQILLQLTYFFFSFRILMLLRSTLSPK